MAYVLLPCELPFWPDVQNQISLLRKSRDAAQVVDVLRNIYRICSAAIDQDERPLEDEMRFDLCEGYLEDFDESFDLLNVIVPTIVDLARKINELRPKAFVYSLQAEDGDWELSREFVASLLAHSFLSTFPLRTFKGHPTLQDFNRSSTFRYLTLDQHKQGLTNLLRYFKEVRCQMDGSLRVRRRVLPREPPLTEWVCSPHQLCPLTVRHVARLEDAEPHLYRVLPINADLGVLKTTRCAENYFLLELPELSVLQLFVEVPKGSEVLVVEGIRPLKVFKPQGRAPVDSGFLSTEEYQLNSAGECQLGLLDKMSFDKEFLYRQYLDESLLFNLNKCLNAFSQAAKRGHVVEDVTKKSIAKRTENDFNGVEGSLSRQTEGARLENHAPEQLQEGAERTRSPLAERSSCSSEEPRRDKSDDVDAETKEVLQRPVARHLITETLLQTQQLLNSPKHPSPRPRKRAVSSSTKGSRGSTVAEDSETLLSRPVGQPLILPRPVDVSTPMPGYHDKRPPNLNLVARAQLLASPPVSSPRRIPSLQSEDSRGSFRTDSGEQANLPFRPAKRPEGITRSLSKTSRCSSFKTSLSKRCSWQVSAEDDYFTAEESFDDEEDPPSLSKTSHLFRRTHWRSARSRSSRTFDSELSMQSSFDIGNVPRNLQREDSTGSAGFVLERSSRLSESDVASSAGRLYRDSRNQYLSVEPNYNRFKKRLQKQALRSSKSRSFHRSFERRNSSDGSSGSDMEDIVEDPELISPLRPLSSLFRRANSEPTLTGSHKRRSPSVLKIPTTVSHSLSDKLSTVFSIAVEGRCVPKAYSFDGVNPNLPVPFKAKFRIRRKRSPSAEDGVIRHALTKEDLDYIKRVVRKENRPSSIADSQDSSKIQELQRNELNQKISPSLAEGSTLPVACTLWAPGTESDHDAQLEALTLWLAASSASVPHLVIYTHGESRLQHLTDVAAKALERQWTCGDLAGELVRFCRNRMSIHRGMGRVSADLNLFMQILQPKPS